MSYKTIILLLCICCAMCLPLVSVAQNDNIYFHVPRHFMFDGRQFSFNKYNTYEGEPYFQAYSDKKDPYNDGISILLSLTQQSLKDYITERIAECEMVKTRDTMNDFSVFTITEGNEYIICERSMPKSDSTSTDMMLFSIRRYVCYKDKSGNVGIITFCYEKIRGGINRKNFEENVKRETQKFDYFRPLVQAYDLSSIKLPGK